jgi:hypothetical protein
MSSYYHVSPRRHRQSIQEFGLDTDDVERQHDWSDPGVYLWDDPDVARQYATRTFDQYKLPTGAYLAGEPWDMWEVQHDGDLYPDPYREANPDHRDVYGHSWVSYEPIDPENLSLYNPPKQANILDPIHDELDPTVWDAPGEDNPRLKDVHLKWIKNTIYSVLRANGLRNPEKFVSLVFTGSLTTYQYSAESDCDVSLFIDYNLTDVKRGYVIGLMVGNVDGTILPGTTHPMQAFVVPEGISKDDLYQRGLRSGYDLDTNSWIIPPEKDRVHDVEKEENGYYVTALLAADKMERLLKYEPDKAVMYWHQIHARRQRDQRAGKGDFAESNIVYKMLNNRGLFPQISEVSGEYIAKVGMAERSGIPELDQAIEEFMQTEFKSPYTTVTDLNSFRNPEGAYGNCEIVAKAFADFLKQRGFKAYATSDDLRAFPGYENAQDSAAIGAGEFSYPEHSMVEVYGLPGMYANTVTVDFTASQYGFTEFPKVHGGPSDHVAKTAGWPVVKKFVYDGDTNKLILGKEAPEEGATYSHNQLAQQIGADRIFGNTLCGTINKNNYAMFEFGGKGVRPTTYSAAEAALRQAHPIEGVIGNSLVLPDHPWKDVAPNITDLNVDPSGLDNLDLGLDKTAAKIPSMKQLEPYRYDRECYEVANGISHKWPHLKEDAGFYVHPTRGPGDHGWNVAPDGTIVDMTAAQHDYDGPKDEWEEEDGPLPVPNHPEIIPPDHPLQQRYVSWCKGDGTEAQLLAHSIGYHDGHNDNLEVCPECQKRQNDNEGWQL